MRSIDFPQKSKHAEITNDKSPGGVGVCFPSHILQLTTRSSVGCLEEARSGAALRERCGGTFVSACLPARPPLPRSGYFGSFIVSFPYPILGSPPLSLTCFPPPDGVILAFLFGWSVVLRRPPFCCAEALALSALSFIYFLSPGFLIVNHTRRSLTRRLPCPSPSR